MTSPQQAGAGPVRRERPTESAEAGGPPGGRASAAESVVDRYYAAFNARDFDAWLETLDDDVEILIDAGVLRGRLAARAYLGGIVQAYPGVTVADRRVVAESADAVVSEFHLVNPTMDPAPDPSAPDRPGVPWRLDGVTCEVLRLREGRISSLHSYYSPTPTDRTPVAEVPSRAEAARIAHRHAALGRVATQVDRGASEQDLVSMMNQVTAEFAGVDVSLMMRFESENTAVLLAASGLVDEAAILGRRFPLAEDVLAVRDSGRALRFGARGWPLADRNGAGPDGEPQPAGRVQWCVGVPIILRGKVWGVSLLGSGRDEPFADDTEAGISAFTALASTALANAQATDELTERAREQSELRQVAEIAAAGADPAEVYAAVTRSASAVLGGYPTSLVRFVDDETADALGHTGVDIPSPGGRFRIDRTSVTALVQRTGRPARIDDYRAVPGNRMAGHLGLHASVGVPVVVGGQPWGMLSASSTDGALPADTEHRLSQFVGTVAAAIAGTQARAELRALADEQAALRRVAELIARGAAERQIYDAVTSEAAGIIDRPTTLIRFDTGQAYTVVASSSRPTAVAGQTGTEPVDERLVAEIVRTRTSTRMETYQHRTGQTTFVSGLVSSVGVPIIVDGRLWGVLWARSDDRRLPTMVEPRLQQFGALMAAAVADAQARGQLEQIAHEQSALRRVAELAAQDAPEDQLLQAVAVEASALAGVGFGKVFRYVDADGGTEIVALGGAPDNFDVGMRAPGTGDGAVHRVWRTGRATRIDDIGQMSGRWARMSHERGFTASAGVPIVIRGALWGALVVTGRGHAFPAALEEQLTHFAELAGTAIAATQARTELGLLADEQAALRRVAELVARGASLDEVFTAAATEASTLLGNLAAALMRYDEGDIAVVVAACNSPVPLGLDVPTDDGNSLGTLRRTGRPVRTDSFRGTSLADIAIAVGVGAGVAVPVTVEGRVWGALTASSPGPPLPSGSEERLAPFAELVAAAIANAENRAKLTASRARVVATADETRRRLQRDVHDGAQQRLVHTIIALKMARDALSSDDPAAALLQEGLSNAERANRELREIVSGILPASLTRGGLRSGLESLVADLALPVDLTVTTPRLPAHIETTAYFVVAEAVTNVMKHADAHRATVDVQVDDDTLIVEVRDDGIGGADPAGGTGLTGLFDRVEASDGVLTVSSSAGAGTTIHAAIPVRERLATRLGDVGVRK